VGRIWGFGGFSERVFGWLLGVLTVVLGGEAGYLGGGVGVCRLWRNGLLTQWLGNRRMRGGCLATFFFFVVVADGGFVPACLPACWVDGWMDGGGGSNKGDDV